MKKLMLVAAVTIASVSAHASKARLSALQYDNGAQHIEDIREAFNGEAEETVKYEAAIVEFGSAGANPNAEGGFIRKMGDAAFGFYLGKPSDTYATQSSAIAEGIAGSQNDLDLLNDALTQSNPFTITYAAKAGGMAWGVGLFYHSKDAKSYAFDDGTVDVTGKVKQDVAGVFGGVNNGVWDAQLRLGLMGQSKFNIETETGATSPAIAAGTEIKGTSKMNAKLRGGYKMDTMYFYGHYDMTGGEMKINGTKQVETENQEIQVGAVNSHKKDGVDFFYGANYTMLTEKEKVGDTKTETNTLKAIVGVEAEANSWMVLRGALSQNIPWLTTSKETGGSTNTNASNSTTTTLGAGFKFGKAMLDVVAGMGSSGSLTNTNGGDIFTNAAVTYNF